MYSYQTYLNSVDALSFDEAQVIYNKLISQLDFSNNETSDLWREFMQNVTDYVTFRSGWALLCREEKLEKDRMRSVCHDTVISSINILDRYMRKKGLDTSWKDQLGEEESHRQRIGDFACYVSMIYSLNSRS